MSNTINFKKKTSNQQSEYWDKELHGMLSMKLPFDNNTEANDDIGRIFFSLKKDTSEKLKQLAKKYDITFFVLIASALKVLLYRYTNQKDAGIAVAFSNVDGPTNNNNILSELILRNEINGRESFINILQQVTGSFSQAIDKQLQFRDIADNFSTETEVVKALYQVLLLNNNSKSYTTKNNYQANTIQKYSRQFDLIFAVSDTTNGIEFGINFKSSKYDEGLLVAFTAHFKQLIISILNEPDKMVGALDMLSNNEKNELLFEFNDTKVNYPSNKTINALFEEQVLKTPHNIALRQNGLTMTYLELNERANRLGAYLLEQGIKQEDNVGLLVARNFDMIIGMYAILKVGAAYVPVDPEYPEDRQSYILSHSSVSCVITDGNYPIQEQTPEIKFIRMNIAAISGFSVDNLDLDISSAQLAYTIYTSGSTGRPKGVMIEHHSVINLVLWVNTTFNIGTNDRLLFVTSMCFDLSVYDIFGMLSSGGSIVIAEQSDLTDVRKLMKILLEYEITFWDSVPTTLDYVIRELESERPEYIQNNLRLVFLSGDWISVNLPSRIEKYFPSAQVISLGGATESTVWSNYFPIENVKSNWKSIPYGKPIANNYFYILNEQLQPVPIGVPGELYIGGVGVARGYANDEQKVKDSFKPNPFTNIGGGIMYKTGDIGRMLPDKNMEFIGRKDNQVKIRGFRVELGEIESVITQSGLVKDVIVMAKDNHDGKKLLIGYVVTNAFHFKEEIIAYLKSKLPVYMIPFVWVKLDFLPLTSNGKIDKKALPEYGQEYQLKAQYVAAQDEQEQSLVDIWQSALGFENIGVNDDFFDIGGHSLLAVQIMSRLENQTGQKFPLSILFKYPTIRKLYQYLKKENEDKSFKILVPIKPTGKKVPLYLIHGDGLNVMNFSSLASFLDNEQPVYGLQAQGLNGIDTPSNVMEEIAAEYLKEILEINPTGPYALAGYSFGGYIAIEMRKQLLAMGKKIKILAIFDTNAEDFEYTKPLVYKLPKKIKKQLPKFLFILKSFSKYPFSTLQYQVNYFGKKIEEFIYNARIIRRPQPTSYYANLQRIFEIYTTAFKNYKLESFDDRIYLFKSKKKSYFVEDFYFLGWKKYALKGVKVYEIPGDHKTMFEPPNVLVFAQSLQKVLDEVT